MQPVGNKHPKALIDMDYFHVNRRSTFSRTKPLGQWRRQNLRCNCLRPGFLFKDLWPWCGWKWLVAFPLNVSETPLHCRNQENQWVNLQQPWVTLRWDLTSALLRINRARPLMMSLLFFKERVTSDGSAQGPSRYGLAARGRRWICAQPKGEEFPMFKPILDWTSFF